jgi:hypothetical protein
MAENEALKIDEVQKIDDDEISLIDLFVVLIKYRRVIIIFTVIGLIFSAGYYVVQTLGGKERAVISEVPDESYEGRMTVVINPRFGRSGTERFPAWFGSRELLETSLEKAGLSERKYDTLSISYIHNDGVDIVLNPGAGDEERLEKFFSILLDKVETMAAAYYAEYAGDIVSYFESLQELGKDYSIQDYTRYCWAKDLLSGEDTVLKLLYPPFASVVVQAPDALDASSTSGSSRTVAVVIIFAFLFFAVFLAFVLNAIRNISDDNEAMSKIRGALGKENKDEE